MVSIETGAPRGLRPPRYRVAFVVVAVFAVVCFAVLAAHNVSTKLSAEDRTAAREILERGGYGQTWRSNLDLRTYDGQVNAIIAVQDAVLKASPNNTDIPFDAPREPADLLRLEMGLCFDRSRSIEKILSMLGLENRHVAVYSTKHTGSAFTSLLTPQIDSHAVTEVKTLKGWMVVDSNKRWVALTQNGLPVSMVALQNNDASTADWSARNKDRINPIFTSEFTYVIGLYSRHGRFFPPYTSVPDVNWRDLIIANVLG